MPSAGWLGLDPTHGELASDSHVAVAVGRSYADVPPNRGVYRGGAEERIDVSVRIQRVDEETPVEMARRPEAPILNGVVVRERPVDLHALEHQQTQQQQQQQQ